MFNFNEEDMKHLEENNVSYMKHFKFAVGIGIRLAYASICIFIHAIYPNILCTTTSNEISRLNSLLNCKKDK